MKNIALFIRSETDNSINCAKKAIDVLFKSGCICLVDELYKESIGITEGVEYKRENELFETAECLVVFGGDGTIMRAAHDTNLPIIGINLGRIGYIAELETNELELLSALADGNYTVDSRMMLDYSVTIDGKEKSGETPVLNDIVLSKGGYSVMPEIELVCNGEEVGKYFCDGLICATPTGSTAYSLSAGGSIVDTGMECFCVTPIAPQSFYAKPLIFGGNSCLEFKKGKKGHGRLKLIADGEYIAELNEGDTVTVKKSDTKARFIRIKRNNFYSVMRSKMTEI